ncbi:MBL fold metallo-hydrolase [Paludisphaera sp.]|uniref:MBL fold metallo-hydrolase n=1 Tax=Paludisphaera sp. TaxID=2017432 RepID=UPI00301DAF0F
MRIQWYGHAAFLVEAQGVKIILDPYRSPDCGGYAPVGDGADVVVVSHENDKYHSHLGQIAPPFHVIRALDLPPGGEEFRGVTFRSVRVFESPERLPGDEVAMIHFESEGLRVAFLGDLGHLLTEAELGPIRGSDVVLIPAGGTPTIALGDVPALLDSIGPRVVVPMHYKTPKIDLNIRPIEDFLARLPGIQVVRPGSSDFTIDRATLPERRTIVRLEYAR